MLNRIAFVLLLMFSSEVLSSPPSRQAVTVEQSFSRTQLYDATPRSIWNEPNPFVLSPDGAQLLVVTGKGDAAKETYYFQLLSFDTSELRRWANRQQVTTPKPKRLVEFAFDRIEKFTAVTSNVGIKDVTFTKDGAGILFIGSNAQDIGQVYYLDLKTNIVRKLTNSDRPIKSYLFIDDSGDILYAVDHFVHADDCIQEELVVGIRSLDQSVCISDRVSFYVNRTKTDRMYWYNDIFLTSLHSASGEKLLARRVPFRSFLGNNSISPDGRHAIVIIDPVIPAEDIDKYKSRVREAKYFEPTLSAPWVSYATYALLNIKAGTLEPLDKAQLPSYSLETDVHWLDPDRVHLGGVINFPEVQLTASDGGRAEMKKSSVIYTVSQKSFELSSRMVGDGLEMVGDSSETERARVERFCDNDGTGRDIDDATRPSCYLLSDQLGLMFSTEERFDRPPDIYVTDVRSGRKRLAYILNPQFAKLKLAKVELFKWEDERGKAWQAGLVYPVNYVPGTRYPLVVQTHGFSQSVFLMDGAPGGTAPYAAQALAAKDIFVLQFPDVPYHPSEEQVSTARGINSAVRALVADGKVDVNRIGISGYSATGAFIFRMLTHREFTPAAALIYDSYNPGLNGYFQMLGTNGAGMLEFEKIYCGTQPWGETAKTWLLLNPFFNIDVIRTPVLLQESKYGMPTWWDIYAGMQRLRLPFELRRYSDTGHPVGRADTVIRGQQLTVDWFDFWLNGRERDRANNEEQYARWRRMKEGLRGLPAPRRLPPLSELSCSEINGKASALDAANK